MDSGTLLTALLGFLGALVTIAPTVGLWAYRASKRGGKACRLLTGEEEFEGDGVIPRLRRVEETTDRHERALANEGVLRADGGPEVDDES